MAHRISEGSNTARGVLAQVAPLLLGVGGTLLAAILDLTDVLLTGDAAIMAGAAVIAAVGLAAGLELRARDGIRSDWLDRLHRLTEELIGAVSAEDPNRAVRDAADRATEGITAPRAMEEELQSYLRSVADQCAHAYERIDLERARQRSQADLQLLALASPRLAASLDVARVIEVLTSLIVPELADVCELQVRNLPVPPSTTKSDSVTIRTVPLTTQGRQIGTLWLGRAGREMNEDDLNTVRLLAEPAARALDHALRFSDERHTSDTLQQSLLPASVLSVPGLQIATRYLAATEGQAVGGDFYDVVSQSDDALVLIVGDVQGKGIEAAALTSAARYTMRSAALSGVGPGETLSRVNDLLLYADAERSAAGESSVRFVTATVVALRRGPGGFEGVVASGGHPPPLVVRPDGTIDQLVAEGPLLGVFKDAAYAEVPVTMGLSDVLILYTDGVTERRRQPELFDEAQLGRLVRNQLTVRNADDVAQVVLDTVMEVSSREARDDIALIVARVVS